mgnify:CR=1 FL=1
MFSLLQRILRSALKHPKVVLAIAFVVTLLSIYPVRNLKWELRLIDMLPDSSDVKKTQAIVEENFGGFGSLVAIITSKDSALNYRLAKNLARGLEGNRYVNFVEYESDVGFFEKNKLLYIHTDELKKIRDRISNLQSRYKFENNPFYVNLLSGDSLKKEITDSLSLTTIEDKYLAKFRNMYSNQDGTVRIVSVFPKERVSDLAASRKLTHIVSGAYESLPESEKAEMFMTGKVFETASEGWRILPEARYTGIALAVILALFFLFRFAKQPAVFILSTIPIALVFLWTLAAAWLLFGRINLYSIILAVILPGISCREIVHLMTRFADEQRKGLGYELSLESALLGIGPTIAVSTFSFAAAFLGLLLVPLKGMQELGTLGAIGLLLTWVLASLVFPALIEITGRYRSFLIFGKIQHNAKDFMERPFIGIKKALIPVVLISMILPCRGLYPKFDYDFSHTEYNPNTAKAEALLRQTDYLRYDPIVVILPNSEQARNFYNRINRERESNPQTGIRSIAIYHNLLPSNQQEKLSLLKEIKSEIDPNMLHALSPSDSERVERIVNEWQAAPVLFKDIPTNIRRLFGADIAGKTEYAFIFPNFNPNNGLACRRLSKELEPFHYPMAGTALVRAAILDHTLPHFHKAILFGIVCVFLLTFLFYKRFYFSLLTLISPIIAFFWLLGLLRFLDIPITAYSCLAFPILIGTSIDGSIQLWNAYYEKSTGSIYYILRTVGVTCFFAEFLTIVVLFGLSLSSHPGIHSIGVIAILGMICLLFSHNFVFPLFAGALDRRRIRRRKHR